jgi:hypothetical protein
MDAMRRSALQGQIKSSVIDPQNEVIGVKSTEVVPVEYLKLQICLNTAEVKVFSILAYSKQWALEMPTG